MARSSKKRPVAVTGSWQPIPLDFLRSRACAELSPLGAKLLLDILGMLRPNAAGNGDISLTPKVMAIRGWSGRASLGAAVQELLANNLLVMTRQGSRLDCSLFALTLYPLDCDISKLDVRPGCYLTNDFKASDGSLGDVPTDCKPALWRRARKTQTVAPPRYEVPSKRSATVRSAKPK